MAKVYKKVWGSFRENFRNIGKSLTNCEENFKNFKNFMIKCAEVSKKIWGNSGESLKSCGENFKKFSETIKKLWEKF